MEQKFSNDSLDLQRLREFCEREGEVVICDELEMRKAHRQLRDAALEHSRKSMSHVIARYL
ncbi:MAG: hypothetical protein IKX33_03230 [Prevotella sp.]|nr:hypothetical protein [Prevotella sp.]